MPERTEGRTETHREAAPPSDEPGRADARRNRDRLLNAAEEAFADQGLGVPIDEIARRAGVGPGTVYRNFPTKEALFEAVIQHHLQALAEEARALAVSEDPEGALFGFLRHLATQAAARRNLVDALMGAGVRVDETLAAHKRDVTSGLATLLRRAQEAGTVRGDVTVEDLFGMVVGCAMGSPSADAASQARMLSVVCEGLRT